MIRFFCSITFAVMVASAVGAPLRTSVIGFYRIEVELGELENSQGYQANGQFCDEVTQCDPVIYAYIDVEKPLSPWPAKNPTDMNMLTWMRNSNSYGINSTTVKDICGGGLGNINARIEVQDEDFLGKYDLIEQFECKFYPTIADRLGGQENDIDRTAARFKEWTPFSECTAKHQPEKLRLFYRWRVYAIDISECGQEPKPVSTVKIVQVESSAVQSLQGDREVQVL
ncbi:hypothetical protein RvY_16375 [Ramazzottius varieornatus]|uniref:Uncharacterized protein n=1 Tax=Ramazzottius varieornatus TaxID=947166 RepID=A0A1D1VZI1_RAMVA|nr:hypothetical protein RvY_16375 [Ramazzottius varieornatus]